MLKRSKIMLILTTLMLLFTGALPAQSVFCVSENGSMSVEMGHEGKCSCAEAPASEDEHQGCSEISCDPSSCELNTTLKKGCHDIALISPISAQRQDSVVPASSLVQLAFCSPSKELTAPVKISKPRIRLSKPSLPPPHLKILELSQVLI